MATKVQYEWSLETVEDGDIVDSDFSEILPTEWLSEPGTELCLVRNEGNENKGVLDRYWAYVKNGKLPEYFSNSMQQQICIKVPQRFHKELNNLPVLP